MIPCTQIQLSMPSSFTNSSPLDSFRIFRPFCSFSLSPTLVTLLIHFHISLSPYELRSAATKDGFSA
jgi:hypothetical protein